MLLGGDGRSRRDSRRCLRARPHIATMLNWPVLRYFGSAADQIRNAYGCGRVQLLLAQARVEVLFKAIVSLVIIVKVLLAALYAAQVSTGRRRLAGLGSLTSAHLLPDETCLGKLVSRSVTG